MHAIVLATGFLLSLAAGAGDPPPVPGPDSPEAHNTCPTRQQSSEAMYKYLVPRGFHIVEFDGPEAHRFLDKFNHTGIPSDFRADHIMVMVKDDLAKGLLYVYDGPCGGIKHFAVMDVDLFRQSYVAARTPPPTL